MPTKTKKEKILAQQHRKFTFAPSTSSLPSYQQIQTHTVTYQSQKPVVSEVLEFALVRRDITKTILLGLSAIGIELGMYWYSLMKP